jgi:hypothetical protein
MAIRGGIVISMLKLLILGRLSFLALWCVLVSHVHSFPHTGVNDHCWVMKDLRLPLTETRV